MKVVTNRQTGRLIFLSLAAKRIRRKHPKNNFSWKSDIHLPRIANYRKFQNVFHAQGCSKSIFPLKHESVICIKTILPLTSGEKESKSSGWLTHREWNIFLIAASGNWILCEENCWYWSAVMCGGSPWTPGSTGLQCQLRVVRILLLLSHLQVPTTLRLFTNTTIGSNWRIFFLQWTRLL